MDTPKSKLVMALEWFWNSWASARKDVVLVVCASATTWMLDKIVHNKGGLYNRLTRQIHLLPFTLGECRELARARGLVMSDHQVLECYMIMGGVPYYWNFLERGKSLSQSIDEAFFARDAPLASEYDYLFSSLFKRSEPYERIMGALAKAGGGLSRDQISKTCGMSASGTLTKRLEELESCGFVRKYHQFGKKEKGSVWQLVDNFTLFHRRFVMGRRARDEHFWTNQANAPSRNAWCGVAFERVCLEHVVQIKHALGVSGVVTEESAWSCPSDPDRGINGSQIDLLIDRGDQVINLCEMKFSRGEYAITKKVDKELRDKTSDFLGETGTRKAVHVTLVTTYGLKSNIYAGEVQAVVTAEDLFS